MSIMEPSTISQSAASEPEFAGATDTFKTANAPANRHFKQVITPGLGGPNFLIPASVSKFFRKRFRRKDAPATR